VVLPHLCGAWLGDEFEWQGFIFDRFERPQILRRKQLRVDFWFRRPSLSFLTKKFFPSDLVERDRLQGNGTWDSGFGVRVRNAKLETRNSLLGRLGSWC